MPHPTTGYSHFKSEVALAEMQLTECSLPNAAYRNPPCVSDRVLCFQDEFSTLFYIEFGNKCKPALLGNFLQKHAECKSLQTAKFEFFGEGVLALVIICDSPVRLNILCDELAKPEALKLMTMKRIEAVDLGDNTSLGEYQNAKDVASLKEALLVANAKGRNLAAHTARLTTEVQRMQSILSEAINCMKETTLSAETMVEAEKKKNSANMNNALRCIKQTEERLEAALRELRAERKAHHELQQLVPGSAELARKQRRLAQTADGIL